MYLGIDGCRGGWLVAGIDNNDELSFRVLSRIDQLTAPPAPFAGVKALLIDIPLGFPEKEYRRCEKEARKLLGTKRGPSVFYTPVKTAVYAGTYQEACEENQMVLGKKISKQTWNICGKIREANHFFALTSSRRNQDNSGTRWSLPTPREAHPELCFLGWSGAPCKHNKKTPEGIAERRQIIARLYPGFLTILDHAAAETPRRFASPDDFLDAAILAITAAQDGPLSAEGSLLTSVPDQPDYNDEGLRQEIVYFNSTDKLSEYCQKYLP